jgi:polar amino acid transport system substrate-binding protein
VKRSESLTRKGIAVRVVALTALGALGSMVLCGCGGTPPASRAGDFELATQGTLTAGVSMGDAPFAFPDPTGKPTGMLVELNDVIASRMGVKAVYKTTTISGGLALVAAGQFDIMLADLTMSEERKRNVAFTTPIYVDANEIVVRSDSMTHAVSDLAAKRVGVSVGSAQADFAADSLPDAKVVSLQTNGASIDQLLAKNLDASVLSSVQAATVLAQHPGQLKIAVSVESPVPEAIAVNKKLVAFVGEYNKQLAATVDDGTFLNLYEKYFPGVAYPPSMLRYWPSLRSKLETAPR